MVNRKKISSLFIIFAILLSFTSCSTNGEKNATRTVVDITGAEVEIPEKVEKVININPFGCQIMFGLGLGDYLIGISEDTFETEWLETMCPESKEIQTYSDETTAETLLAAKPDVVFSQDPDVAEELRKKGVPCVTFGYLTIDDYKFNINLIGDILGGEAKKKCDSYNKYIDERTSEVEAALSGKIADKESMYYINANSDDGFYKTAGSGSTTDYCADLSFVNLSTDTLIDFPESRVDAEALLATNPENVIIGGRYQHVICDEILKAYEWQNITAIKENNVFKIPMGLAAWNRYSLETALLIPWTASVIYPEYYDFDAVSETIAFYKKFMGYELSEKQAKYMIEGLTPNGEKEITSR